MRNSGERRLQAFVTVFCASFFALFCFTFVAFYKSPLLQMVYTDVATGRLEYNGYVVSGILTIILVGLALWMNRFAKFQREWTAMAFLPSAVILAFLTSIDRSVFTGEKSYAMWVWVFAISFVVYLFFSFVLHRILFEKIKNLTMVAGRIVWRNLILLVLLFVGVGALSGGDKAFVCEAVQYNMYKKGNIDAALKVGENYAMATKELTVQRAFLLSLKGLLGESLFEYLGSYGAEALLPDGRRSSLLVPDSVYALIGAEREDGERALGYLSRVVEGGSPSSVACEYYLSALLADCRLVDFVDKVFEFYNVGEADLLPKHYKEALLLYAYVMPDAVVEFEDKEMLASFENFVRLVKSGALSCADENLYSLYGSTYWWYYFCASSFM